MDSYPCSICRGDLARSNYSKTQQNKFDHGKIRMMTCFACCAREQTQQIPPRDPLVLIHPDGNSTVGRSAGSVAVKAGKKAGSVVDPSVAYISNPLNTPVVRDARQFFRKFGLKYNVQVGPLSGWRTVSKLAVRCTLNHRESGDPLKDQASVVPTTKIGLFKPRSHEIVACCDSLAHHPTINKMISVVGCALSSSGVHGYVEDRTVDQQEVCAQHNAYLKYLQIAVDTASGNAHVSLVWNSRPLQWKPFLGSCSYERKVSTDHQVGTEVDDEHSKTCLLNLSREILRLSEGSDDTSAAAPKKKRKSKSGSKHSSQSVHFIRPLSPVAIGSLWVHYNSSSCHDNAIFGREKNSWQLLYDCSMNSPIPYDSSPEQQRRISQHPEEGDPVAPAEEEIALYPRTYFPKDYPIEQIDTGMPHTPRLRVPPFVFRQANITAFAGIVREIRNWIPSHPSSEVLCRDPAPHTSSSEHLLLGGTGSDSSVGGGRYDEVVRGEDYGETGMTAKKRKRAEKRRAAKEAAGIACYGAASSSSDRENLVQGSSTVLKLPSVASAASTAAVGVRCLELYGGVGTIGLNCLDLFSSFQCSDENPYNERCFQFAVSELPESLRKRVLPYRPLSATAVVLGGGPATASRKMNNDNSITGKGTAARPGTVFDGFDVIIVDPPRKGLDDEVVAALLRAPNRSVADTVSCEDTAGTGKLRDSATDFHNRNKGIDSASGGSEGAGGGLCRRLQRLIYVSCGFPAFKRDAERLVSGLSSSSPVLSAASSSSFGTSGSEGAAYTSTGKRERDHDDEEMLVALKPPCSSGSSRRGQIVGDDRGNRQRSSSQQLGGGGMDSVPVGGDGCAPCSWRLVHAEGHVLFPGADHVETLAIFDRILPLSSRCQR